MTKEEAEAIYDNEIAPKLVEVGKRCRELGMSFVAMVEYHRDDVGLTGLMTDGSGIAITLAHYAARANGNVDALAIGISKYAQKNGHSSMYLNLAGVPAGKVVNEYRYQKTRDRLIKSAEERGLTANLIEKARFLCGRDDIKKVEDLTPMETEAMVAVIEQHPIKPT